MIENQKDLEKLLKMCRKQGVTKLTLEQVSFELGPLPEYTADKPQITEPNEDPGNPYANFPTGELTPTQLAFYSAGGAPEDDPELQQQ